MAEFTCKNRGALTILITLIFGILMFIDYKIEMESSTWTQWVFFWIGIMLIIYIHFIACVDEVEYSQEYHSFESAPSMQDKQVAELTEELKAQEITLGMGYPASKEDIEWANQKPEQSKEKIFYVVQPIHVTQEEFNEKINPQIDMENKDNNKELPKALANPEIVIGYSLHNVHKKFRPMYNDICEFAINGGTKTEADITAKLKLYGYTFTTERADKNTIAFNLDSSPKIRLPEKGYFGIK